MPELDPMKIRLTRTVYATPLMTLTTDLGLSIRVSMFEYVRLVTGTSSGSPIFFPDFSSQFLRNSSCSSGIFWPSTTPFRPMNRKKPTSSEIRQLCPISDLAKKTRGRRSISDKIGKTEKKGGLEISTGSGLTPVERGSGEKAPPLAARPVPWNGWERRLVELTDGCYGEGDSLGLPGWIK